MKLINFLVVLFALSSSVAAQLNKTDSKGLKQGTWEKKYPNSSVVEYRGTFKDNKPVGEFNYFYPSTKPKAIIKHQGNGRSIANFFHETGELMSSGIYKNLKKDSLWFQFNEQGKVVFSENYLDDLLHGKKTVYFPPNKETGKVEKIASILIYANGQLDGEYLEYFEFGGIRVKGHYKNGLKAGQWMEYQPSGKPLLLNRFRNGEKHGWCSAYDAMGKEVNKVFFYFGQQKEGKDLEFILKQLKEKGINPNE